MHNVPAIQERIKAEMRLHGDIDRVEQEIIKPAALTEEVEAALWLYAWSFIPPHRQRKEMSALAVAVG